MKWAARVVLALVVLAVGAAAAAFWMVRSTSPALPLESGVDHEQALVLRRVLESVGDPRRLDVGDRAEVTLSQADLDALAAEASRRLDDAAARATLREGALAVTASAVSPRPAITPYVDVHATVRGALDAPQLDSVRLGALPIPAALVQPTFDRVYAKLRQRRAWLRAVIDAVDAVELHEGSVTVRYRWTDALAQEVHSTGRGLLLGELGLPRVLAYQRALATAMELTPARGPVPLGRVVSPLFAVARHRVDETHEPRLELQAALLVGTLYALDRPLGRIVDADVPRIPGRRVVLWERDDLPKHFLVSALLAVWGDRAFADALGLSKEVTDSQGGSGFSFADLAADRSGTALAERGTQTPEHTRALFERLASPLADADLVPDPTELPEGLTEAAFARIYETVGSPAYDALVARIDERIAATSVQRALPSD